MLSMSILSLPYKKKLLQEKNKLNISKNVNYGLSFNPVLML